MLSFLQATAILSILMAFGVDQPTVDKIRDILIPPIVNIAPISVVPIQIIQTPIQPDSPVYFGSTQPPVVIAPVVESRPMEIPNWTIKIIGENAVTAQRDVPLTAKAKTGMLKLWVETYNKNGVREKIPITVTTNDPDMPSTWLMNVPRGQDIPKDFLIQPNADFFYVAPVDGSFHPITTGTFYFTFTVEDVSTTTQVVVMP